MGVTGNEYFLLFVISFALVGLLTPLMRTIAIAQKIMDKPDSLHKSHKESVPYLGGVAIIFGIVSLTYATSIISEFTQNTFWLATSVLLPASLLGFIGLIDDMRKLSPWPRFIAQTAAALFTAILLITTDNFGNPTGSKIFDVCITVIWIVGICNSINFFDNLDGGAAGTIAACSIGMAFLSINSQQYLITAMSVVTIGAMLGFLIWNKSPARIYMGDAGALFLGVLVGVLTIRLKPQTNSLLGSYSVPILLLAVPIMDTSVAIISRIRRHISPFQGGQDHLSHRLIRYGVPRKTAALILWALSMFFVIIALAISFLKISEVTLVISSIAIWASIFVFFIYGKDS